MAKKYYEEQTKYSQTRNILLQSHFQHEHRYCYCNNNRYGNIGLQNNIVECVLYQGLFLIRMGLCRNSIVPYRHSFSAHLRFLNNFVYKLRGTITLDFANRDRTLYEGELCIFIYVRADFYMYFARQSNRSLFPIS